ncbi:MAG: diguanylate cyclase domain-containing protein [Roseateles sp.]|uniref:diguanylate cyclase domain-containing protein n=1 Tax=Roseateles sp. TaxID=1971397 RepID=UPI004035A677
MPLNCTEGPPPARPCGTTQTQRVETVDALEALLARHLARSRRHGDSVALLWLEVELMTPVDPAHGSRCEEAVALALSARLRHRVRETDRVFQLGAAGFAVVLVTARPGARLVERRLIEQLRGPYGIEGRMAQVHVQARVGLAVSGEGCGQGSSLLQVAMDDVYVRRQEAPAAAASAARCA